MVFVDRRADLASAEALLKDRAAKLGLLYGRRRLGKTALLAQILTRHDGLFLTIPEQTHAGILHHLGVELGRATGRPLHYKDLDAFFRDLPNHGVRLVILDEVQRLFETDRSAASRLQAAWDHHLKDTNLVLILCGSVIGTLSRLRDAKSPLYGRFAWHHHLPPFTYAATRLFYPDADETDRVRRYAVFGATPHYHDLTRTTSLHKAIRRFFLDPGAPFREEPRILFQTELRRPDRYLEILEAMADGCMTLAEVAGRYGQPQSAYTTYAKRLREDLRLIRLDDPVAGKRRKGRIAFTDPFFHFYYRFVYPNLGRIELQDIDGVAHDIQDGLDTYYGRVFETVLRETLRALNGNKFHGHAIRFSALGGWWQDDHEVDAVALGEDTAYAGEAKFQNEPIRRRDISRFLEHARAFHDATKLRRLVPILLTRSRLDDKAREAADAEGVLVLSLDDLASVHTKENP